MAGGNSLLSPAGPAAAADGPFRPAGNGLLSVGGAGGGGASNRMLDGARRREGGEPMRRTSSESLDEAAPGAGMRGRSGAMSTPASSLTPIQLPTPAPFQIVVHVPAYAEEPARDDAYDVALTNLRATPSPSGGRWRDLSTDLQASTAQKKGGRLSGNLTCRGVRPTEGAPPLASRDWGADLQRVLEGLAGVLGEALGELEPFVSALDRVTAHALAAHAEASGAAGAAAKAARGGTGRNVWTGASAGVRYAWSGPEAARAYAMRSAERRARKVQSLLEEAAREQKEKAQGRLEALGDLQDLLAQHEALEALARSLEARTRAAIESVGLVVDDLDTSLQFEHGSGVRAELVRRGATASFEIHRQRDGLDRSLRVGLEEGVVRTTALAVPERFRRADSSQHLDLSLSPDGAISGRFEIQEGRRWRVKGKPPKKSVEGTFAASKVGGVAMPTSLGITRLASGEVVDGLKKDGAGLVYRRSETDELVTLEEVLIEPGDPGRFSLRAAVRKSALPGAVRAAARVGTSTWKLYPDALTFSLSAPLREEHLLDLETLAMTVGVPEGTRVRLDQQQTMDRIQATCDRKLAELHVTKDRATGDLSLRLGDDVLLRQERTASGALRHAPAPGRGAVDCLELFEEAGQVLMQSLQQAVIKELAGAA